LILVIAVNYRTAAAACRFVESLRTQHVTAWRCRLVDNGDCESGRAALDELPGKDARISIVRPGGNLGYFGGLRRGLASWTADGNEIPEWSVVGNVDIVFDQPDFLACLQEVAPTVDVVAPSIISTLSGLDQNPYLVSPLSKFRAWRNYMLHSRRSLAQLGRLYTAFAKPRLLPTAEDKPDQRRIYAPHGSLICFRRSWFDRGGTLDHEVFLFGEEISVGEQARALGARIEYVPSVRARHDEHNSTGLFLSKTIFAHQQAATRYVWSLARR